jgi:poly(3-hydroxybutyrate) depolymerase
MKRETKTPRHEHSVPWFWPLAAAVEMEEEGLHLFQDNLQDLAEVERLAPPKEPKWASPNTILLDLDTMRVRDFSPAARTSDAVPVLVDAPYAGHSATIADYAKGQSLVGTLLSSGLERVLVTDWKAASEEMRDFDIDKYLAEINVAVDDLGGRVNLVGLCQGGWMSAMYASRFPGKVVTLVLAGAPIDTDAGDGPIKKVAHELPMSFYEEMVAAGGGRMLGQYMLAGWKNMHPGEQYVGKFIDLYEHIEDRCYIKRTERFERWYENPIDLPGRYYLQAIQLLFKENRFARGAFTGLGHALSLKDIDIPVYLLAGDDDDITPKEQVFAAERLLGTPKDRIEKRLAPGGHIGLFMGSRVLKETWPGIARWIGANGSHGSRRKRAETRRRTRRRAKRKTRRFSHDRSLEGLPG